MDDFSKYTPTQLLKIINDTKQKHDSLKEEIINDTYEYDELEKKINNKLKVLSELEKNYVKLIEEMEKK